MQILHCLPYLHGILANSVRELGTACLYLPLIVLGRFKSATCTREKRWSLKCAWIWYPMTFKVLDCNSDSLARIAEAQDWIVTSVVLYYQITVLWITLDKGLSSLTPTACSKLWQELADFVDQDFLSFFSRIWMCMFSRMTESIILLSCAQLTRFTIWAWAFLNTWANRV